MDVTGAMRITEDVEASPEELISIAVLGKKVDHLMATHPRLKQNCSRRYRVTATSQEQGCGSQ